MKRFGLFLLALAFVPAISGQQSKFSLKGDISKLKAPIEWVYLTYNANNQRITDSVQVKQDSYSFAGNIDEPMQVGLRVRYKADRSSNSKVPFNSKRDYATLFLEPGNIAVVSIDSFSNITVTGSKADAEYRKLQDQSKPYDTRLADLYAQAADARKNKDTATVRRLEKQIDSTDAEANEKIYGAYVKQHPASPIALYALRNWAGYEIDAAKIEPVFNTLAAATRNSASGKDMQEKIAIAKKTGVGQMAIDFTQADTLGNPLALNSFKGKYVLLDFWASWCGPCRAENPNLVKTFEQYSRKGFQILSVSLDRPGAKEKWMKAIHDDGLNWWHVSDLKFWDNAVARQYGIEAIPQNLLIDPSGKIIAKNLQGEDLSKKLATIYTQ